MYTYYSVQYHCEMETTFKFNILLLQKYSYYKAIFRFYFEYSIVSDKIALWFKVWNKKYIISSMSNFECSEIELIN